MNFGLVFTVRPATLNAHGSLNCASVVRAMAAPKFAALESTARILELFDRNAAAARAAIARTTDAQFKEPWAFKVAGRTVNTSPKYTVYRHTVLNHLVHHRGQLTVYLRLNGVPVPAVHGPTADEPHF